MSVCTCASERVPGHRGRDGARCLRGRDPEIFAQPGNTGAHLTGYVCNNSITLCCDGDPQCQCVGSRERIVPAGGVEGRYELIERDLMVASAGQAGQREAEGSLLGGSRVRCRTHQCGGHLVGRNHMAGHEIVDPVHLPYRPSTATA